MVVVYLIQDAAKRAWSRTLLPPMGGFYTGSFCSSAMHVHGFPNKRFMDTDSHCRRGLDVALGDSLLPGLLVLVWPVLSHLSWGWMTVNVPIFLWLYSACSRSLVQTMTHSYKPVLFLCFLFKRTAKLILDHRNFCQTQVVVTGFSLFKQVCPHFRSYFCTKKQIPKGSQTFKHHCRVFCRSALLVWTRPLLLTAHNPLRPAFLGQTTHSTGASTHLTVNLVFCQLRNEWDKSFKI